MAYHHGDLHAAILAAAADAVLRDGPGGLSLRGLAREVGVTHTAPRHHFGDRRGVITALATQGYLRLAGRVRGANESGSFLDSGAAYIDFALTCPAHFQVMFRPDLVNTADPLLREALDELSAALAAGAQVFTETRGTEVTETEQRSIGLAAWSMAHGFATLALGGNFPAGSGTDLEEMARQTLRHLSVD